MRFRTIPQQQLHFIRYKAVALLHVLLLSRNPGNRIRQEGASCIYIHTYKTLFSHASLNSYKLADFNEGRDNK